MSELYGRKFTEEEIDFDDAVATVVALDKADREPLHFIDNEVGKMLINLRQGGAISAWDVEYLKGRDFKVLK